VTFRRRSAIAGLVASVAAAAAFVGSTGSGTSHQVPRSSDGTLDCSSRSLAEFPGAYINRRNLVVGPLVLIGGAELTPAKVVRRFGGQKYPLLVKAGHTVTLRVSPRSDRVARLEYSMLRPKRAITFVACGPQEESGSSADGEEVTFWSGGVAARRPTCVRLDVFVDGDRSPRPVAIPLGKRCPAPSPLRDCRSRAEGTGAPQSTSRPGDVVVGPFAFAGLRRAANRRAFERYRTGQGYLVKAGAALRAGTRATLAIARRARGWASLSYGRSRARDVSDGDPAVRFHACSRDEPAFSYTGPVGITTSFAGGFLLSHRGCVPLEVRVHGHRPVRARIPFGRRC
jgi:hypothetical protein